MSGKREAQVTRKNHYRHNRGSIAERAVTYLELKNQMNHANIESKVQELVNAAQHRLNTALMRETRNTKKENAKKGTSSKKALMGDMYNMLQEQINAEKEVESTTALLRAIRKHEMLPSQAAPFALSPNASRRKPRMAPAAPAAPAVEKGLNHNLALQLQLDEVPSMRVVDLKAALQAAGLSTTGLKAALAKRYSDHLRA